jgi:hypothetical protein
LEDRTTNQRLQPVENEVIYALNDNVAATTTHVVVLDITSDSVGNPPNEIVIDDSASDASGTSANQLSLAGFDTTSDLGPLILCGDASRSNRGAVSVGNVRSSALSTTHDVGIGAECKPQ